MAVPNYSYLKLKIPSPKGIITIGASYQRAYECDIECYEYAVALVASKKLSAELIAEAAETHKATSRGKKVGTFKTVEGTKTVVLDVINGEERKVHVGTGLSPK
jgi:hypothetical protein